MIDFFEKTLKQATYELKEGTNSSYYRQSGTTILPNRLSISKDNEMAKTALKGRNMMHQITGQMIGTFTKKETSILKQFKPYVCRTQIWQMDDYPLFIGYGTIGISNEKGRIDRNSDTGDLVVFFTPDRGKTIQIFFFPAMEKKLNEIMKFLSEKYLYKTDFPEAA